MTYKNLANDSRLFERLEKKAKKTSNDDNKTHF